MNLIKKNLKGITIIVIIAMIIGLLFVKWNLKQNKDIVKELNEPILEEKIEESEKIIEEQIEKKVFVDIKGAVNNPGVYEIEESKKVIDVIGLAGGFTDVANTSMINLAKQVTNEMVIIIYTNEEVRKATEEDDIAKVIDKQCICPEIKNDACLTKEEATTKEETIATTEKVNLNTATLEELQTLPGIGTSKAEAIIEYRNEIGQFGSVEQLKEVSGIGEALFEKIKDHITI